MRERKRVKRFSEIITAHCGSKISVEWWIVLSLKFLYGTAGTADAVDMHACMHVCVREIERERSTRERKKGKTVFHYLHCALWLEYQRGAPSRPSLQLTVNSVRNEAQENHASQPAVAGTGCCGCPQGYSFYFGGAAGRGSQTASHASHRSTCGCW